MSARAMMLASMLALGLADTDANGRAEGGNESGNERHEGGAENGNERYGNEGANERREEDNDALHSRLLINAASSAVDMFAISRSLETFAVQNDKVVLKIYPLFVCPSGACPNGVCPEKQALLAGLGCVVNTQAPPRVVPLQAGAPVPAAASGTSVLDFVVHSADPKFGGVAIQRIEAAVTQNLLANQGVTGFKRIMEVGGDVEGGNENHEGGEGGNEGRREGENNEGRHGAGEGGEGGNEGRREGENNEGRHGAGEGGEGGNEGRREGENNEGRHGAGDKDGEGDENNNGAALVIFCTLLAIIVTTIVAALIYYFRCETKKEVTSILTYSEVKDENMEDMNSLTSQTVNIPIQ